MARQWILVAHQSGARLFERNHRRDLALVEEISHPEGRLRNHELDTDRDTGRGAEPQGFGVRATPPNEDAHTHQASLFAKQLGDKLSKGVSDHRCEQIVLVASPKFLVKIKDSLDTQAARRVVALHEKDYAWVSEHELGKRLGELLEFS